MEKNFEHRSKHLKKSLDRFSRIDVQESEEENVYDEIVGFRRKKMSLTGAVKSRASPLELERRIVSFKQLGLTNPFHPTTSFNATFEFLSSLHFSVPIYPQDEPPKCIFLPTSDLFQKMIAALAKYGHEGNRFFDRFSL
jgi:hypothetical protein